MIKAEVSKSKKIINSVLFVLFTLFAVIQLNDPDPLHWFLIYMGVAVISLGSNFIVIPKTIIVLIILGLLVYAAMHFMFLMDWLQTENKSEILGEMVYDKPYLEGSREFLGLLIASSALFYQLKR